MKIIRITLTAIVFYSMLFISCQSNKNNEDQTTKPENAVREEVKAEAPGTKAANTEATEITAGTVLKDTIGLYKISNAEAKTYIVRMNTLLASIEKAMDNNAPERMPALMNEVNEHQQKQLKIQSKLSEADRVLFMTHMDKVADKLLAIAERMGEM